MNRLTFSHTVCILFPHFYQSSGISRQYSRVVTILISFTKKGPGLLKTRL